MKKQIVATLTTLATVILMAGPALAVSPYAQTPTADWPQFSGSYKIVSAIVEDPVNRIVYASGFFTTLNGSITRNGIAAFDMDTGAVLPFNPDVAGGRVVTMALSPDGSTLYAGGYFSIVNQGTTPVTRINLAAFDTATGVATSFDGGVSNAGYGSVNTLELTVDGSLLYVGGQFTTVKNGTVPRNRIAAFDTSTGAVTAFDPNITGTTNGNIAPNGGIGDLELSPDESILYVAGIFSTVNGNVTRNEFASFTTADGIVTSFDPNCSGPVYNGPSSIDLSPDGSTLYAGGSFTACNGGVTRNRAAAFDSTTGTLTAFNPNIGTNNVRSIVASSPLSTNVYVGGKFTNVNGGVARSYVAELDPVTGAATPFDLQVSAYSVVTIVATSDALYIGGENMTTAGCVSIANFARMEAGDAASHCDLNGNGIPDDEEIVDTDGDGVNDDEDQCVDTPGLPERAGCPIGDYISFTVQTIGKGKPTFDPIQGVQVKVFDADTVGNPQPDRQGEIFESTNGYVGSCTTNTDGVCVVGEMEVKDYVVVAKYNDTDPVGTVYLSGKKTESDFYDGEAYLDLKLIKKYDKNGFDRYLPEGHVETASSQTPWLYATLAAVLGFGFALVISERGKKKA